jgi:hypothetical protein
MTTVYLQATGIAAPGLPDWSASQRVLCGEADYCSEPLELTPPELLPAAERRRSSDSVRLALRVAAEALPQAIQQPMAVFSSAYGDPGITHKLCELLSTTPPMASPTLFHNSVHNAPAGYWSIATGNPATTTSIAAGEQSFAQGLLYAAAQCHCEQQPVLLLCYDLPYPAPLDDKCPITAPFACALLLSSKADDHSLAQLSISLGDGEESYLPDDALESLRTGNPAARSLPLLQAVARGSGECRIAYTAQQQLYLSVTPCS